MGVLKAKAHEIFTRKFEMAVRHKKMTMDRKEQLLYDIQAIADSHQNVVSDQNIGVEIQITPIPGSYDFVVDLCVYKITSESLDAETMDVHYASCLAMIRNATNRQKESVRQLMTNIITSSTQELEENFPGGKEKLQDIQCQLNQTGW